MDMNKDTDGADFIAMFPSNSSRNKSYSDLMIAIPQMRRHLLYEV